VNRLFDGANVGKLLVRVSDEPAASPSTTTRASADPTEPVTRT
jgi:hypothetical protein